MILPFKTEKPPVFINGKPVLIISFSGGQTSAYMSVKIKKELGHIYHLIFIFSNTGCENNETLNFVNECDKAFNLNIVWVEAVVNPQHGKGITHRVTNYNDAFRFDQFNDPNHPFHAHIKKSGIPNPNKPQCSDRLKAFVIEDYKRKNGLQGQPHAIGIRGDESNRIISPALCRLLKSCGTEPTVWRLQETHEERIAILQNAIMLTEKQKNQIITYSNKLRQYGLVYPLTDWDYSSKSDVNDFWEDQHFRLMLEDHEGNCMVCWKKTDRKLFLIALEHPERFDAFDFWENTYDHIKTNDNGQRRVFFRKNRCSQDIIKEAQQFSASSLRRLIGAHNEEGSDGCSESCESYSLF